MTRTELLAIASLSNKGELLPVIDERPLAIEAWNRRFDNV